MKAPIFGAAVLRGGSLAMSGTPAQAADVAQPRNRRVGITWL